MDDGRERKSPLRISQKLVYYIMLCYVMLSYNILCVMLLYYSYYIII